MKQLTTVAFRLFFSTICLFAFETVSGNISPTLSCDPPNQISLNFLNSSNAGFSWSPAAADTVLSYDWQIQLAGFSPSSGAPLLSGTTADTFALIPGLTTLLDLSFFVRINCPNGSSDWAGPFNFTVPPGCGDAFTDPGGPLGNYPDNAFQTTVLCPPAVSTDVMRINFISFDLEENQDFLKIYDGTDNTAPLLVTLTGSYPVLMPPPPVTATNSTGCLTTVFISSPLNNAEGWSALLSCAQPDSCLIPGMLTVSGISSDTAQVSWNSVAGASHYEWRLGVAPYLPTGTPVQSDTLSANSLVLSGLSGQTTYTIYVRTVCDSVSHSGWTGFSFTTPIACGDTIYDTGGPLGNYSNDEQYTTVICPNIPNTVVSLDFTSFDTQNNRDILTIFNGNNTSAPAMGSYSGTINNFGTVQATTSSGCLTLEFTSDNGTTRPGWQATVLCTMPSGCFQVVGQQVTGLTSHSANIQWAGMYNATDYQWKIGVPGFNPASAGLQTDTVNTTSATINNLSPNTGYDVYVRSICTGGGAGAWSVVLSFTTPPGCGDHFYDSGGNGNGSNYNYNDNEDITTVICPDHPGQVVTLDFNSFKTSMGDVLRLYNGTQVNPLYILDSLQGNAGTAGPYTGTLANGCLTAHFTSDASQTQSGWDATVSCAALSGCPAVDGLQVLSVTPDGGTFSWARMANAQQYEWEVVPTGLSPILTSTLTSDTFLTVTGQNPVTTYDLYVRADCGNGQYGDWVKVTFTTMVNCFTTNNTLSCDLQRTAVIAAGNGAWQLNCSAPPFPTYGRESVYIFTPPVSQQFLLDVAPGVNNSTVSYFYKAVSEGCNDQNWHCIDDFNSLGGVANVGPLVANTDYFILLDANFPSNAAVQTFKITNCAPLNDEASGAFDLTVNAPCSGNINSNSGAGYTLGEPDPDVETDANDNLVGRWLDAANRTVWFKFVAPASGTVTVTSDAYPQGTNFDTQIALYAVGDPSDYSTFQYIESDEDNGTVLNGFNAIVYYTGLTPGQTYYVQVDGYGVAQGTFCLQVLDGIERAVGEDCFHTFTVTNVDGTQPGGDHWYGIYTTPDILDLGLMVAAVKPGNNNLGTVYCQMNVSSPDIPVAPDNVPYMPAYFAFSSDHKPTEPLQVRLFFYNYELNALKAAANLPGNSAADLVVSRYNSQTIDCTPDDNQVIPPGTGTITLLTSVSATTTSGTASFYLDVTTDSLGEFGAHFGTLALPVELNRFSGTMLADYNLLQWQTASEHNSAWFVVERSADGHNWQPVGQVSAAGNATQPNNYQLADRHPLPAAYYRLHTVDLGGANQISQIIYLARPETGLQIARLYPNPVQGNTTLEFADGREERIQIFLYDLTGRLVKTIDTDAQTGLNQISLDLSEMPAGLYTLQLKSDSTLSLPFKVVRQ